MLLAVPLKLTLWTLKLLLIFLTNCDVYDHIFAPYRKKIFPLLLYASCMEKYGETTRTPRKN